MITDIQQAASADMQEKIAETHEYLRREKDFARRHQEMMERRYENAIRIGQNLLDFKTTLPHGKFITFVQTEFGLDRTVAWDFMNLVHRGTNVGDHQHLSLDVRIELASPSMPATVIEMVETKQIPPTVAAIREAKGAISFEQWSQDNITLGLDKFANTLDEGTKGKRDAHVMRVMGSSESPEWYTPQDIVQLSIELLGEIELDPCSNSHESPNVPARSHYTKEDDGLAQTWEGKVYLNPPYGSEIPRWVEKLVNSYGHGVTEAIALLPGRIDTLWFSPLYAFPMCNVRGRIQYENSPYHAPFPCVIVYLGNRLDDFIRVFGNMGPIMKKVGGR